LADFSDNPLKPALISSKVKTPLPSLSSFSKSLAKPEISFSDNYEAMNVKAAFFNFSEFLKFFNDPKFNSNPFS